MRAVVIPVRAFLIVLPFLLCSSLTIAQNPLPRSSPPPQKPVDGTKSPDSDDGPLTTFEEEIRAKRAIKMAEKDHQENLNRAREIAQIGKELQQCMKNQSSLDREAVRKIDRLEKLTKKIRGEA